MAYITRSSPTTCCVNRIAGAHAMPLVVISRLLRGDGGHSDVAVPVSRDLRGEVVVGSLGETSGFLDIQQRLRTGRGEREDRLVDPRFIHVPDALRTEVEQPLDDLRGALGGAARVKPPERHHASVRRAVLHHAQVAVDLLARREGFLGRYAQVAAIAAGLELVAHASPSWTAFTIMHDITPSGPFSDPWPDHLTPPNGESGPPSTMVLIQNMPVSTSRASRFCRAASFVQL